MCNFHQFQLNLLTWLHCSLPRDRISFLSGILLRILLLYRLTMYSIELDLNLINLNSKNWNYLKKNWELQYIFLKNLQEIPVKWKKWLTWSFVTWSFIYQFIWWLCWAYSSDTFSCSWLLSTTTRFATCWPFGILSKYWNVSLNLKI